MTTISSARHQFPPAIIPAHGVTLRSFYPQQPRRGRSARRAGFGCLPRIGDTKGIEIRDVVRPGASPQAPLADFAVMEWMPPPDGFAMCQGGDICRIPRNGEGVRHLTRQTDERYRSRDNTVIGLVEQGIEPGAASILSLDQAEFRQEEVLGEVVTVGKRRFAKGVVIGGQWWGP